MFIAKSKITTSLTSLVFRHKKCLLSTSRHTSGINLAKYPWLTDLSSPAAVEAIDAAKLSIATTGIATFPNFVVESALQDSISETARNEHRANLVHSEHNVYYSNQDAQYARDHVRNVEVHTKVAIVPYDALDPSRALVQLYTSDLLKELVGQVSNRPTLFRSADPFGRCSINILKTGWSDEWHFDESEFTTTLMLQKPVRGGHFQASKQVRKSNTEYAFDKVKDVMTDSECSIVHDVQPGTLSVFCGRNSLHRVTPVEGPVDRYVAVFTFSTQKDFVNTPETQKYFFGRVQQTPVEAK